MFSEITEWHKAEEEITTWKTPYELLSAASGHLVYDYDARTGDSVILIPMTDIGGAAALAERLRTLAEQYLWENPSLGKLHITVSFGVAAIPSQNIETAEHLIACAEKALHRAKANGGNRVEIYDVKLDGQPFSTAP